MSSDETENLKTLIKKRASIKTRLTFFEKYLRSFDGLVISEVNRIKRIELNQRIINVENLFGGFDEIQNEIECLSSNVDEQFLEREEFENKLHATLARAKSISEQFDAVEGDEARSQASSQSNSNQVQPECVKLPEIKLPTFDGTYETWMEFRDIFESLIHSNKQINTIQKYHYLRASLVGAAILVIQSLEFSSSNYDLAWNTLCDRFNNKQLLIQNHLKSIFQMDNINTATAFKIRHLYESLFKHLNSLKMLGEPTDSWDTLLIYIITNKLDNHTAQEWEKFKSNYQRITLDMFKEFLKKRANLLETLELNTKQLNENKRLDMQKSFQNSKNTKFFNQSRGYLSYTDTTNNLAHSRSKYSCYNCKKEHSLFYCPEFLQLGVKNRIAKVKELKLCLNCLKRNHSANDCKWSGCKQCGFKHNTILHELKESPSNTVAHVCHDSENVNNQNIKSERELNVTNCTLATAQNAILSTARVAAYNKLDNRNFVYAKALLDCGSQSSFITSDLCNKLKLAKTKIKLAVSGISENISYADYKCELLIRSISGSFSYNLSCFVLDKITSFIPDTPIDVEFLNIPVNINLADSDFNIPQPIDILIGADAFWHILSEGQLNLGLPDPILQNTHLGWIIAGCIGLPVNNKSHCNYAKHISVQDQLAKFWEIEEVEVKNVWSPEEHACEDHFVKNVSVNNEGRFVVSLPFKKSPESLGNSRETALKRFLQLEKKLISNEKLRMLYIDFLNEYGQLGHMTNVSNKSENEFPEYYMPHHGVLKESNLTTKLRVVFDGSCATSTGVSLNDLQMTGPIIQNDLLSIILRFRTRSIVLSSDVKMMYRQVLLHPDQRKLQKILWRSNPNENMKTFELNTITYGTTAGSFLAIRCLHEIANECEIEFPQIANIIRNDMYVDDLLSCVDTEEEAKFVCKVISQVLLKHGFELRKWKSNNNIVLQGLNTENTSRYLDFSENKEEHSKTLGLSWDFNRDILTYKINKINRNINANEVTKRTILSRIAAVFDPLGLISPCVIIAKVLLQKLWSEKLTWDEPVPAQIRNMWLEWSSDLEKLNQIKISRNVVTNDFKDISLHGFADACESSYGACLYVISINSVGQRFSNLLCAKSKVSPVKSLTIPKLELSAALILSQLISKTLKSLNIKPSSITCWSDSTIVLGWLKTSQNLLKPFVANRVVQILQLTDSFEWRHIPTVENPADIVSRGLSPAKLVNFELWFHGPQWLLSDSTNWPSIKKSKVDLPEIRKPCIVTVAQTKLNFPFERFSDLNKLKRSFAWLLRFLKNSKLKSECRNLSHLTVDELNESFNLLLRIAQQESFFEDYLALTKNSQLPSSCKILSLHPFIDPQGIIRVGGRLTNSSFPYSKKHPILLSPHHILTKLIFESEHKRFYSCWTTTFVIEH